MALEANIHSLLTKGTGLTEQQVQEILKSPAGMTNKTIEDYLSRKEHTSIEGLLKDLCEIMNIDFIKDIPVNDIPVDLIRDISITYAKTHEILPFKDEKSHIVVLTTNPIKFSASDDLRVIFGKPIKIMVTTSIKLLDAINRVYEKSSTELEGLEDIEQEDFDLDEPIIDLLESPDDEAPVIKLVNTLLYRAVKEKASDIHIEPYEKDMVIRFRIDGILFDIYRPHKKLQNAIVSRIKVMGNLNIAEKRLPQGGRLPLKAGGKDIDIRLSTVPTTFGERIVMRLQDRSNVILELDQLGFTEDSLKKIEDVVRRTYGIFLVTGPTGSGKSTTLYACLQRVNTVDKNILTLEDPVEQRIHGIGQVQIAPRIGLTFAEGLRHFLRQDPNIIMVGEIRDSETATLAIEASITGHLVLTTLHTNDAATAFPRLIEMGAEPFLIATSLLGVVAQRLVRILCPHCKEPYEPSDYEMTGLGLSKSHLIGKKIYRPIGCSQCNQKGYTGRTIIQELLMVTDSIKELVLTKADGGMIKKRAVNEGMRTFRDHGIEKVLNGTTSIEEVLTNTQLDI